MISNVKLGTTEERALGPDWTRWFCHAFSHLELALKTSRYNLNLSILTDKELCSLSFHQETFIVINISCDLIKVSSFGISG